MLTKEYLETLVPYNTSNLNTTYDTAMPIMTHTYDNTIDINVLAKSDGLVMENEDKLLMECKDNSPQHLKSSYWHAIYGKTHKEIRYGEYSYCTFALMIDVLSQYNGIKLSIEEIRNQLAIEYNKYVSNYSSVISDILIIEGKKTMGNQLKNGMISCSLMIHNDGYYLTIFDFWLLALKYKLPIIILGQQWFVHTEYKRAYLILNLSQNGKYIHIFTDAVKQNIVPKYRLMVSNKGEILNEIDTSVIDVMTYIDISEFLTKFVKSKTTYYVQRNPNKKKENVKKVELNTEQIKNNKKQKIDKLNEINKKKNVVIMDEFNMEQVEV
jgi:hypothetical protein